MNIKVTMKYIQGITRELPVKKILTEIENNQHPKPKYIQL